jgi:hypothetical protein
MRQSAVVTLLAIGALCLNGKAAVREVMKKMKPMAISYQSLGV